MPEATDETLSKLVEHGPIESYRIEGTRYSGDARYLGVVGISNLHSIFHASGFSGGLSPDSRFLLKKLQRPGQEPKVFVLFRQFDASPYQASPEDLVAGWVPAEEEGQAQSWVDGMNAQIKAYGVTPDAPSAPVVATPSTPFDVTTSVAGADAVNGSFNVRTRFTGTAQQLIQLIEPRLGCRFSPSEAWQYEGLPAFEAVGMGMSIALVEFPPVGEYPRRFNLTGNPLQPDVAKERHDRTGDVQALLGDAGVEWYVPTRDEVNTEAGL